MCYVQLMKKVSPAKSKSITWVEFWLICFMVFKTTFNNITEYTEKTTELSQVTDNLYNIMFYASPWSGFELTTSAVIGTDCIGSCKSNYHTVTAITAPVDIWSEMGIELTSIFQTINVNCSRFYFSKHGVMMLVSRVHMFVHQ